MGTTLHLRGSLGVRRPVSTVGGGPWCSRNQPSFCGSKINHRVLASCPTYRALLAAEGCKPNMPASFRQLSQQHFPLDSTVPKNPALRKRPSINECTETINIWAVREYFSPILMYSVARRWVWNRIPKLNFLADFYWTWLSKRTHVVYYERQCAQTCHFWRQKTLNQVRKYVIQASHHHIKIRVWGSCVGGGEKKDPGLVIY